MELQDAWNCKKRSWGLTEVGEEQENSSSGLFRNAENRLFIVTNQNFGGFIRRVRQGVNFSRQPPFHNERLVSFVSIERISCPDREPTDNGATALSVFAGHKEEVGVVITDMMMPVMDGPATIRALRKLNPQVRIIASSGLAESIDAADLDHLGAKTFLIKPYDAKTLLKTVARALR